MDLSFASPHWLWALFVVPVLALFELRAVKRSRRAVRALVGERTPHVLLAQERTGERRTGALLRLGALALLVAGAAGPQWGRETVRRPARGSDLVFVLDVSASMDVRDVAPSRMAEARREALALLDRVEGSRVGVLVFAGDAVRLCPLTLDHAAARLTLETISSSTLSAPGTDLGRALDNALQMLPAGKRDDQAIVVWTDGEDLEGHASKLVDRLRGAGVRFLAVGVGTPGGDVIPVMDDQGRAVDVKRDEAGVVVRSRLGERLLRDLARATRGGYFSASRPGGELPRLSAALGSLARTQRGSHLIERAVSRFPWAALLAAGLLVAEQVRPRRQGATRDRKFAGRFASPAARAAQVAAAVLAAALLAPASVSAQTAWAKGDGAFRRGQWADAESLYAQRVRRGAPPPVQVNLATARARQGKPLAAWEGPLERLGETAGRAGAAARYNLGTLFGERKDYDRALVELRRALERDPNDADARWNYELLARDREAERQKQDERPKDPKQEKPEKSEGGQGSQGQQGAQGQQPPQPQGGGAQQQPAPGQARPHSSAGASAGMTTQQAEQLLGSLQELERLERQRARRTQVTSERRGKDW